MPKPVGHASPENVGFGFLVSYWTLDCLCLCSRAVTPCAALIVTDGRQIRCQPPKRAEQLAALISTHFRLKTRVKTLSEALRDGRHLGARRRRGENRRGYEGPERTSRPGAKTARFYPDTLSDATTTTARL